MTAKSKTNPGWPHKSKKEKMMHWLVGPPGDYPPIRTLKDMSPAEIAALEQLYGCKVLS